MHDPGQQQGRHAAHIRLRRSGGTIVVAAVPETTVRVEAVALRAEPRELAIADIAGPGFRLVFADLDEFIPDRLIAYDAAGPLATATVVSTGGAPPGYLPTD